MGLGCQICCASRKNKNEKKKNIQFYFNTHVTYKAVSPVVFCLFHLKVTIG